MDLPARVETELRDCDYGRWAGRSLDAVQKEDPKGIAQWLSDPSSRPHGGESLLALLQRLSKWLSVCDRSGQIVAITHASVVRAAVMTALDSPPHGFWRIDASPLSVTWLHRGDGRWRVRSVNQKLRGRPAAQSALRS